MSKINIVMRTVVIAAMLMAGINVNAQGIIVNKTDGTQVRFAASDVRSITTYGYDDEPSPTPGGTQTFTVNGVSFTMVSVEGGTFYMGSDDSDADSVEKPAHQVRVSGFSIGQTEVTQALWEAVMDSNPSYWKGLNHPVETVSWDDCQTFIAKLNNLTGQNFRLPTEAEWEFAARGGNMGKGYKYSGSNTIGDVAWYYDNCDNTTHDVAMKLANELGIYDMSGNVLEWCQDWLGDNSSSSINNPKGPSSGSFRVFRGGCCWNGAECCRVSKRDGEWPSIAIFELGLRLAL